MKGLFGVVAGPRLSGKSTLGGTLPGTTLFLQCRVKESGSRSAEKLAARLGNKLVVEDFQSIADLQRILATLTKDTVYDHVYIDGLTAITELKHAEPRVQALLKANVWDGFREIGDAAVDILEKFKVLTYPTGAAKPKNVFVTCALKIKTDKHGSIIDVDLETKGNIAVTAVTRLGEFVGSVVLMPSGDSGKVTRRLVVKSTDTWPGRVDELLDDENPGDIEPSLATVLKLTGRM